MENPNFAKLSSMHFYAWQKGLKTGMYYLRSKAATDPIKFTLSDKHQRKFVAGKESTTQVGTSVFAEGADVQEASESGEASKTITLSAPDAATYQEGAVCTMQEGCLMCGS